MAELPQTDKDVKGTVWGSMTTNRHTLGGQGDSARTDTTKDFWLSSTGHVQLMPRSTMNTVQYKTGSLLKPLQDYVGVNFFFSTKLHGS